MQEVLLLFSGGKDSFISACRLVEEGYRVMTMSFNNGAVIGEENFQHSVMRLQNRYGNERVQCVGVYGTSSIVSILNQTWADTPMEEFASKWPYLVNAQLMCLHCQTAMWVSALAYAKAKSITFVASGYRSSDMFCTGLPEWVQSIGEIAKVYGIEVIKPVWDTPSWDRMSGWWRDDEMVKRCFELQVLEPKCVLGRPVKAMTEAEKRDMMSYFHEVLERTVLKKIEGLSNIFKYIKLSSESVQVLHYPVPDPKQGTF